MIGLSQITGRADIVYPGANGDGGRYQRGNSHHQALATHSVAVGSGLNDDATAAEPLRAINRVNCSCGATFYNPQAFPSPASCREGIGDTDGDRDPDLPEFPCGPLSRRGISGIPLMDSINGGSDCMEFARWIREVPGQRPG